MNLSIWQRASDGELFEDFFTWIVEEEKSTDRFIDDLNNAVKADYGAIPQRVEGDRVSLTQTDENVHSAGP